MYAEVLEKYATSRGGSMTAYTPAGYDRSQGVLAILHNDQGDPWFVAGRLDRPKGDARPHLMRIFVWRATNYVNPLLPPCPVENPIPCDAYYMEGGRELKAFLEMRPFESKGVIQDTDWRVDMRAQFDEYHAQRERAEEARRSTLSYAPPTAPEASEEARAAVWAYAGLEGDSSAARTANADNLSRYAAYAGLD